MTTFSALRVGCAAVFAMVLSSCDVPPDPTPLLEPVDLPSKNITLVALDLRTLAAIRKSDGVTAWTYHPPSNPIQSSVARRPSYLTCRPALAKNGTVLVAYTDRLAMIDADTGLERWMRRYKKRGERVLCPAVAADSGVLFFVPSDAGNRFQLVKLDPNGEVRWRTTLPDVGAVIGAPQVRDDTGDIAILTRAHVVGLSPDGVVGWVRDRGPVNE